MIDIALIALALGAAGLTIELYAVAQAPLGYQDEGCFPLGGEPQHHRKDYPGKQPN